LRALHGHIAVASLFLLLEWGSRRRSMETVMDYRGPLISDDVWRMLGSEMGLSPRQLELARHMLAGRSLKRAAHLMGLSVSSAAGYRSRIFARLHISHQGEFVMLVLWRFVQGCSQLRCPRVEDQ